jgi:hypothetical protein
MKWLETFFSINYTRISAFAKILIGVAVDSSVNNAEKVI